MNSSPSSEREASGGSPALIMMVVTALLVPGCRPAGTAQQQQQEPAVTIGEKITIHSKKLNEDRTCWVSLPSSYDAKLTGPLAQRYPVLYLLDAEGYFQWASPMARFMSDNSQIPEVIVVGILNTKRERDLTPTAFKLPPELATNDVKQLPPVLTAMLKSSGGGEAFMSFVKEELIPRIDGQYRTSAFRLLVGHSLGGLMAVDDFLRRPSIFNAWIATDPSLWWDEQLPLKKAKGMLEKTNDFRGLMYLAISSAAPPPPAPNPVSEFAELLEAHPSPWLHSSLTRFPGEDHGSTPLISVYNGLLFVFKGYKFKPPEKCTVADVNDHFAKFSRRLGFQVLPPELLINGLGYERLGSNEVGKALEFFLQNVKNYADWNAYDSLAEAYARKGDEQLAAKNYKRSLELNPKNEVAQEWLKKHKLL